MSTSTHRAAALTSAAVALAFVPGGMAGADGGEADSDPRLVGRAVLPVETYAPGPPAGTFLPPGVVNGIQFPLPSQPVEGSRRSSMARSRASGWR
jgi:glycerophosphoryl diester phosphodiesterase